MGTSPRIKKARQEGKLCFICPNEPKAGTHFIGMLINGWVCEECYDHFMSTLHSVQARQFMDIKPISEN